MLNYIVRRMVSLIVTFFILTMAIFLLVRLAPGDPVLLLVPEAAPDSVIRDVREKWGLDKPLHVQYVVFMSKLLRGNLGTSIDSGKPVWELLLRRIPATLELGLSAWFVATFAGLAMGIVAAYYENSWVDASVMGIAALGRGIPGFWFGVILILIFAVNLGWLPSSGREAGLASLVLPLATISIQIVSYSARISRGCFLEVLTSDYIQTARSKGLNELKVVGKHALKNALIPIVTLTGVQLGRLLGAGMVITESVFNWPGVGHLLVKSIYRRDYPVIQGGVLLIGALFLMVNFIVDLTYCYLNPKIKYDS